MGGIDGLEPHYDEHTWSFIGIVEEFAHYDIRTMVVDLVQVRYMVNDEWRLVWVAGGIEHLAPSNYGSYITRGEWQYQAEMFSLLEPGDPIRVLIKGAGNGQPLVTKTAIDWSACITTVCQLGAYFAETAPLDERFVFGGTAPGWYPWGFLFWRIEMLDAEYIQIWRLIQ